MSPVLPREERDAIKPRVAAHPTMRDREWLRYVEAIEDALDAAEAENAEHRRNEVTLTNELGRARQDATEFCEQRDAARAEVAALRGRGRAHVASLVGFAETAPTRDAQYDATMTARLIEHVIGDESEDGPCGACTLAADEGERTGRCVVCRRQLTEDDTYWHHARLGVDVCDTCPKTNVCGEDITHHAMLWHIPRKADDE